MKPLFKAAIASTLSIIAATAAHAHDMPAAHVHSAGGVVLPLGAIAALVAVAFVAVRFVRKQR